MRVRSSRKPYTSSKLWRLPCGKRHYRFLRLFGNANRCRRTTADAALQRASAQIVTAKNYAPSRFRNHPQMPGPLGPGGRSLTVLAKTGAAFIAARASTKSFAFIGYSTVVSIESIRTASCHSNRTAVVTTQSKRTSTISDSAICGYEILCGT